MLIVRIVLLSNVWFSPPSLSRMQCFAFGLGTTTRYVCGSCCVYLFSLPVECLNGCPYYGILFTGEVDMDRYSHFEISWSYESHAIQSRPLSVLHTIHTTCGEKKRKNPISYRIPPTKKTSKNVNESTISMDSPNLFRKSMEITSYLLL